MINITGATELLQAQQSTFEALHATIAQAEEALDIANAELTALADSTTLEDRQACNEQTKKVALLQEALRKARGNYERIHKENGPLVLEDATHIIREHRNAIKDKHLDDYALIRQKEAEIEALKETINQSERAEKAAMHQFISEVRPYLPENLFNPDGSRQMFNTPESFLSNYAENGNRQPAELFTKGGQN